MRQGIGDDALELFSAGVALELIKGDGRRKARGAHGRHVFEAAHDAIGGGAGQGGDVLNAAAPAQQIHDPQRYLMREALIFPRKGAVLCEALPAFRARVPSADVTQNQRLPAQLQVSDRPHAVIMNALRSYMAARARF